MTKKTTVAIAHGDSDPGKPANRPDVGIGSYVRHLVAVQEANR